jgi:hypothetical protein
MFCNRSQSEQLHYSGWLSSLSTRTSSMSPLMAQWHEFVARRKRRRNHSADRTAALSPLAAKVSGSSLSLPVSGSYNWL